MKMMKRTLCLVLALVMLVGMFTVGASALDAPEFTEDDVTLSQDTFTYSGNKNKPKVTVIVADVTLVEDTDYVVTYSSVTDAGVGTVTVTGKGSYEGIEVKKYITINPKPLDITVTAPTASYEYNGNSYELDVSGMTISNNKVKCTVDKLVATSVGTKSLTEADFYLSGSDNQKNYKINSITINGGILTITAKPIDVTVKLASKTVNYDGKEHTLEIVPEYTISGTNRPVVEYVGSNISATEPGNYEVDPDDFVIRTADKKEYSIRNITIEGGVLTIKATVPTTPLNPTPAIPRYLKNAVLVSCGKDHHDTLTLDIEKLSADAQITMSEDKKTATIRLSDEDYSAIVAAYNTATDAKHSYVNKLGTAIVLKYKDPCFPFHMGGWFVDTKAEMELTCECEKWCGHHCGGWWHKHVVTYTDGVRGEVIFKDIDYTVKHGAKTPVPATPVRAGYKFAGWTPAVATKTTKCVTYTATWVPAKTPALTKDHVAYLKGYGGGLVKPEGEITRAEAITMLYRLMDKASAKEFYTTYNAFTDVAKDAWYNDAVSTLANAGVLRYTTGLLNPNEKITRAEFFYMLTKFSNATYTGKTSFVDVPSNYWAYEELALAQYLGWIKGYGAGILNPDDTITRAEVAASLNRVLGRTTCTVKDTKNFTDNPVNAWYYDDIVEASIAH